AIVGPTQMNDGVLTGGTVTFRTEGRQSLDATDRTIHGSVTLTVNAAPATNLAYSSNPATYHAGTVITANTPKNDGGAILSYSSGPLPADLRIDATTGVISGTPTKIVTNAAITITGTNGAGSTQVIVHVTVDDPTFGI